MRSSDPVTRGELALILDRASAMERTADGELSREEAERIAVEVGVSPDDFHRALAEVRASRLGRDSLLGPPATLSTVSRIPALPTPNTGDDIVRAMLQGQTVLPQYQARIEEVAPGVWRSSTRGSLLQVTTGGTGTEVAVTASRPWTKVSMILGGSGVGGLLGGQLGALLAIGLTPSPGAVGVAIAAGGVAGLVAGLWAGASTWRATARSLQNRMMQAADRVRSELSP
jgi:hypothetical protein